MSASPTTPPNPPKRRPRLRFTLRLLLAFVTLICLALGIWTHRAREQRRILRKLIQSESTHFYYDYQFRYHEFVQPGRNSWLPPMLIDYLGTDYFHCVASIRVEKRELVADLSKLHGVEEVEINDPLVADEDLVPIARMRSVKGVLVNWPWHPRWPISDARISDETLRRIGRMPNIEDVHLGGKNFSRIGITELANAPELEYAHLWGCELAGESLPFEISSGSKTLVVENDSKLESICSTKLRLK